MGSLPHFLLLLITTDNLQLLLTVGSFKTLVVGDSRGNSTDVLLCTSTGRLVRTGFEQAINNIISIINQSIIHDYFTLKT
jgi:hypothetical protein